MDKGWSWAVLVSCFVSFYFLGWYAYTVGVVHVALMETYHDNVAKTAWVGALHSSMMSLVGPLAGMVISRYDCRACTILGGVLVLLGFTLSTFVTDIDLLLLTYGFIAGVGTGLSYCPTVVVLCYNFKKYLGLAVGVAMSGAGLGIFSGGPIVRYFLDLYGLSGAFLLMGGIGANICVCGMLFRPSKVECVRKKKLLTEKMNQIYSLKESLNNFWKRNIGILSNRAFVVHCVSVFSWNLAQSAIFLHLPFYAQTKGTSPEAAAALFTGLGIFSIVARILTGVVLTDQQIDSLTLHLGTLGMASIVTILFPLFSSTYVGQTIYSCLIGFYLASPIVLLNPLTVDLVGLEHLHTAFGLEIFGLGIGYLLGPPIVGLLVDLGCSYDVVIVIAGCCLLFSSLVTMGTAALHGQNNIPAHPCVVSSLSVLPTGAVSTLSLRSGVSLENNNYFTARQEDIERDDLIRDRRRSMVTETDDGKQPIDDDFISSDHMLSKHRNENDLHENGVRC